ncbi:hypothetical protein DL546_007689 [Coniochaeta pulveracea]|uniref:Uncharacterized protein n=1 Tax=Coniochaeta pulveracea TaxID=177199 RepID=A0A420YKA3_9PEZI|nr:hypothetical protein DL546_007689 [Coniochaeta pulveracea]
MQVRDYSEPTDPVLFALCGQHRACWELADKALEDGEPTGRGCPTISNVQPSLERIARQLTLLYSSCDEGTIAYDTTDLPGLNSQLFNLAANRGLAISNTARSSPGLGPKMRPIALHSEGRSKP